MRRLDTPRHTLQSVAMSLSVQAPAAPTLWRTCRALANQQRLLLLRYLVDHPYRHVSDVACALHMPLAVTSQYLRTLNARGMLRAVRVSTRVFYQAAPDPSISQAGVILNALIACYRRPKTTVEDLCFVLTGFTHPRRIQLIQELARGARNRSTVSIENRRLPAGGFAPHGQAAKTRLCGTARL